MPEPYGRSGEEETVLLFLLFVVLERFFKSSLCILAMCAQVCVLPVWMQRKMCGAWVGYTGQRMGQQAADRGLGRDGAGGNSGANGVRLQGKFN
ncbi:hypothetical protein [Acetobacter fabarum]|uniref:hypothetical protein n=1 Tax=Acetobacter fabarum TaxID=483199 RepID=UPI0039ED28C5